MVPVGFESFIPLPQLLNRSKRTLRKQVIGPGLSTFEIRTNFSLALEKVGSYTRGFTVLIELGRGLISDTPEGLN